MPTRVPALNPLTRPMRRISWDTSTVDSAAPTTYAVTGSVASDLSSASANPARPLTDIRIVLLVNSSACVAHSSATFFLSVRNSSVPGRVCRVRSALLELSLAEHDLARLVVDRIAVRLAGQHLQGPLHRGSRIDRVEPAPDVRVLVHVDAAA